MGWKNWSYWVRGGIIGLAAAFPILIIELGLIWHDFRYLVFSFLLSYVHNSGGDINSDFWFKAILVIGFVAYAIIGSIIGLIYEKIKNRKQNEVIQNAN